MLSPHLYPHYTHSNTPPGPTPDCASGYFPGSGCWYMCDWCEKQLGTKQFYWKGDVCTYSTIPPPNGCQGSPQAGVQYTCCKT